MTNKSKHFTGVKCFAIMLLLRELYLIAMYLNLNGVYYVGTGSYGIEFVPQKEVLGSLVFLVLDYFYSYRKIEGKFKNILLMELFILYIIPMSCSYSLMNMSDVFFVEISLFCILLIWAIGKKGKYAFVVNNKELLHVDKSNTEKILSHPWISIFCFICCIVVIAYKVLYNGFSLDILLGSEALYDNRAIRSLAVSSADGTLLGYFITLISNLTSYIIPIYLFLSIKEKKYFSIIISSLSILCSYSVSSEKSTIMIIGVVFVVAWCSKKNDITLFEKLLIGGVLIGLVYSILFWLIAKRQSTLFMLIFRRLMYLPSWLNTLYYKFFAINPKVWWSQNTIFLQKIIPDVYNTSPIALISEYYFKGVIPTPNTGLFADAYMNLGVLGIIVYPLLYKFTFNVAQKIYSGYGWEIEVLVATKLVLALTNVQFLRSNFVISFVFSMLLLHFLTKLNRKT